MNSKINRHYYNYPTQMRTVKFIKKTLLSMLKILDNYPDELMYEKVEQSQLKEIIYQAERVANVTRQEIEQLNIDCPPYEVYEDSDVKVTFEDGILRVFTPLTFPRKKYEYLSILTRVRIAFDKFESENPEIELRKLYRFGSQVCVFQIRKVHKIKAYLKDNNNENGAVINEVLCRRLAISDNPQSMVSYTDMCMTVGENEPTGVEHLVIPKSRILEFIPHIYKRTVII